MSGKCCPDHPQVYCLSNIAYNDYSCPHCGLVILDSDEDSNPSNTYTYKHPTLALDMSSLMSEESDSESDSGGVKYNYVQTLDKLIAENKKKAVEVTVREGDKKKEMPDHSSKRKVVPPPDKHFTFAMSDLFTDDESDEEENAVNHANRVPAASNASNKRKAEESFSKEDKCNYNESHESNKSSVTSDKFYPKDSIKKMPRIAHLPSKRNLNLQNRNKTSKFAELMKIRSKKTTVYKFGQKKFSPKKDQKRLSFESRSHTSSMAMAMATSSVARSLSASTFKIPRNEQSNVKPKSTDETSSVISAPVRPKARPAVPMRSARSTNRHAGLLDSMKSSSKENAKKEEPKTENRNVLDEILGPLNVAPDPSVSTSPPTNLTFNQPTLPLPSFAKEKSLPPKPPVNATTTSIGNNWKKPRFSQSEYDVAQVLEARREARENAEKAAAKKIDNVDPRRQASSMFGSGLSSSSSHTATVPRSIPTSSRVLPLPQSKSQSSKRSQYERPRYEIKDAFNSDPILADICGWSVNWLGEYMDANCPPPLCENRLIPLKLSYDSVPDYQDHYIPLMKHETWAEIHEDYWKRKDEHHGNNVMELYVSPNYKVDGKFINISCQTIKSKSSLKDGNCNYPLEGYLTILELCISSDCEDEENRRMFVFAYVKEFSIDDFRSTDNTLNQFVIPQGPCKILRYELRILRRSVRIIHTEKAKMKAVCYLKPTLRKFEVILAMENLKISHDILKPRPITCKFSVPTTFDVPKEYNESQYKAILASNEAINRPSLFSKLLLIQGPPGTGKTHTLVGIIKYIYLNWDIEKSDKKMPRILICAPSNGAIDEIARRLYREKDFLSKRIPNRYLRLLRIGQYDQVHEDVKKITVEKLTSTNLEKNKYDLKSKLESKNSEIERKISHLDQKIADYRARGNREGVEKAEAEMSKLAKELNRSNEMSKRNEPKSHDVKQTRQDLINHVDVVLTTLNSSRQSLVQNLYNMYGPNCFNCVIVDEASQCSEPELMMPLAYGMNKVILIGDPMQLPATVISKKAADFQYGRSLFERLFHFYGGYEGNKETLLMLTEQYRMHTDICSFPSQHFYSNRLISHASTNKVFPITPYAIIDVIDTQESTNNPSNKFNKLEAEFVLKVVATIDTLIPEKSTIGIITPYQGQKHLFNDKLMKMTTKIKPEVNTIDGFQGQERDVIIISCVRASDNPSVGFLRSKQRMNVALTRAKHSLIICVSGKSLECDTNWKALLDDAKQRHKYYRTCSNVDKNKITMIVKHK